MSTPTPEPVEPTEPAEEPEPEPAGALPNTAPQIVHPPRQDADWGPTPFPGKKQNWP